jgi:hypothetical protein
MLFINGSCKKKIAGQPISVLFLCEKALIFNQQLGGITDSKESPPQNKQKLFALV